MGVFEGFFEKLWKTCFTNCKLVCHKKCILQQLVFFVCFGSKTTIFVRQSVFFKKVHGFVPARFFGGNTNWTKMVHVVLCTASLETKKLWNHYLSAVIWLLLISNTSQILYRKTLMVFLVPEVGFVSKVHWWCLKQSAIFWTILRFSLLLFS